jgi:hypothetical protein
LAAFWSTSATYISLFARANCTACHSGPALSNNRVLPATEVGTEPARATALRRTERIWEKPKAYSFDQAVPLPPNPRVLDVPTDRLTDEQIPLAYGWSGTPGGFKVMHLVGLYWTAPYLHDGGVAVGANADSQLGMAGTLRKGINADSKNSLRALVDRELRRKVVAANAADPDLAAMNVRGVGHEFWVDAAAGFTPEEQEAFLLYLLTHEPQIDASADSRS